MNFHTYLMSSSTLVAVIFPLCFCVLSLFLEVKNSETSVKYYLLFLVSIFIGMMTASWSGSVEKSFYGLHIFPIFFILFTGNWMFNKNPAKHAKCTIISLAYLNVFVVDLIAGYYPLFVPNWISFKFQDPISPKVIEAIITQNHTYSYFGIGGAGFEDCLFITFCFATVSMVYNQFTEKKRNEETLISNSLT